MTPTSTSAPTMTNRPMKKTSVAHSTSCRKSLRIDPGDGDQHAGAEQGDDGRLQVQRGVQDEADHHGQRGPRAT